MFYHAKIMNGIIIMSISLASAAYAETCLAPTRPFVPADPEAAKEFEDLILKDFENYIGDVQDYFRCMESERARAFEEAREVTQEFGQFLTTVTN